MLKSILVVGIILSATLVTGVIFDLSASSTHLKPDKQSATEQHSGSGISHHVSLGNNVSCARQESDNVGDFIDSVIFETDLLLNWLNIRPFRNTVDLIEIGFENEDLDKNGLHSSGNPPQINHHPDYIFEGSQSLKVCIDRRNSPVEYRTEFILSPTLYDKKFIELEYGKEYWVGFAILLDNSYQIPRLSDIIFQVHGKPDLLLGEGYRYPVLSLSVSGDLDNKKLKIDQPYWTISINGDQRKVSSDTTDRTQMTKMIAPLSPVKQDIGRWVTWVLHFKHTYVQDGFVEIWKNGDLIYNKANIRTTYNDSRGSYFKAGSYKWSWRNKHDYPTIDPAVRISYLDSLRIAQGIDRYNDVDPLNFSNSR
ncbi:MAG: polysaccharide lyase [Gammaproteobacteria bacterium]|nr:polysaccharide lyase [Gammaproteobacteria bacterium]